MIRACLVLAVALPALLAACAPQPLTPEAAARVCEARARDAAGPRGEVQLGANSNDGPFVGGTISISADALSGRDPLAVYEACVRDRTGADPIRPPVL